MLFLSSFTIMAVLLVAWCLFIMDVDGDLDFLFAKPWWEISLEIMGAIAVFLIPLSILFLF